MITWSPGTEESAVLVELMREALPEHGFEVHQLDRQPLEPHVEGFASKPGYASWRGRLADRGVTHVHFLFLRAAPANEPGVKLTTPRDEITAAHEVADGWLF